MAESLNVVALISGGKDSIYSLLHCIQNGHKVVALANLYPFDHRSEYVNENEINEAQGEEDINSFMYQTVGHSVVPLYADALQLPLYRRQIAGSAVQTSREYTYSPLTRTKSSTIADALSTEQDETEDLMPLLQTVLQNHPEVNAINTGAIQSTYQRTRIESIALRLNLTPLAYLWQYPVLPPPFDIGTGKAWREDSTTSLLDDMAAVGCESRIIKIASGGIRESLLWSDVTNLRTRTQLVAGLRKFFDNDELGLRGAVVGEGGEFETLALNGPKVLWKGGRIVVNDGALKTVNGEGGAYYVHIGAASVVAHTPDTESSVFLDSEGGGQVRVPRLLDQQFDAIQTAVSNLQAVSMHDTSPGLDSAQPSTVHTGWAYASIPDIQPIISPGSIQIANITYLSQNQNHPREVRITAKAQMRLIAELIPKLLSDVCIQNNINPLLTSSAIVSTMLLLRDMSNFASINPIYATIFEEGVPIPPARVTVAAALPESIEVMLSVVLDLGPRQHRRGLHVQGRSYWAPANIGPYSQAVAVPYKTVSDRDHVKRSFEIVHVAGQIPLVPVSMDLSRADFTEQAILSLQHLWRVGQERGVDHWTVGVAFLPEMQLSEMMNERVVNTGRIWKEANTAPASAGRRRESQNEEEDFDVWHLRHNRSTTDHEISPGHDGRHLHQLPSPHLKLATSPSSSLLPAFIAAEVTTLPRNASVEWWSVGLTGLDSAQQGQVVWKQCLDQGRLTLSAFRPEATNTSFVTCLISKNLSAGKAPDGEHIAFLIDRILNDGDHKTHAETTVTGTAFVATSAAEAWHRLMKERPAHDTQLRADSRVPHVRSYLKGLSIVPCHRLWGYKESEVDLEIRTDNLADSEQLDMALILRIDARSS